MNSLSIPLVLGALVLLWRALYARLLANVAKFAIPAQSAKDESRWTLVRHPAGCDEVAAGVPPLERLGLVTCKHSLQVMGRPYECGRQRYRASSTNRPPASQCHRLVQDAGSTVGSYLAMHWRCGAADGFYAGQSTWLRYQARLRKIYQLLLHGSDHEEGEIS